MYGPNTNPGGGSYIFIAECQARYITDLLVRATEAGVGWLECRQDVHDEFNRQVDEQHGRMVWSHPGVETYDRNPARSEEHTSELKSLMRSSYAVFCLKNKILREKY